VVYNSGVWVDGSRAQGLGKQTCKTSCSLGFGPAASPSILHPTPYNLHPTSTPPFTLHPTPYTLHPTPYTPPAILQTGVRPWLGPRGLALNFTPYTLLPTPYPLHPQPCTLHPAPYTLHHPTRPHTLHPKFRPAKHRTAVASAPQPCSQSL